MSHARIGSLFSGIGGLERGLEIAGAGHVDWQCEIDPWCRGVLERHWPGVTRYDDVRTVPEDAACDILCGGFPCQDISLAGARVGLDGERSGLWYEFVRLVGVLRPSVVFVENVADLVAHLGRILGPLAALGFHAEWDVFRASEVGAPHARARAFVVAYSDRERLARWPVESAAERSPAERGLHAHDWREVPPAWGLRVDDGSPGWVDRAKRVKALGNAVVPQQAALAWTELRRRALT